MYIVFDEPNITDFEDGFTHCCSCFVKSLAEFEQVLNENFGTTDLNRLTIVKLEGTFKPIELKKKVKEVFVESNPKSGGIK